MTDYKKYIFPGVLTILGLILVINGISTEQNGAFMFGAFGFLLAGLISVVAVTIKLSRVIRMGMSAGLILLVGSLAYADFMSIKVPIEFKNEKERRYEHVIQRLKDIRTAEIAYKIKYQKYAGNLDTLMNFVKNDSISVIKAIGEVPDTMSLEDAIKAGVASRDTQYVSVMDTLFLSQKAEERAIPFHIDSMRYVPFTGKTEFKLAAGMVERSSVEVPVFQATDARPFDKRDILQVGSMNDPKTNGNWE